MTNAYLKIGGGGGGGAPTGAAGGSLGGTYPNPTVIQVDGSAGQTTNITGPTGFGIDGYVGATQVLDLALNTSNDFVAFGATPAASGFIRTTQAAAGVTKIGVSKNTGSTDVTWASHWHVGPGDDRFELGPGSDSAGGGAIVCVGNSTMNLQASSQVGITNTSGVPLFIMNPSQIGGAVALTIDGTATSATIKQVDKATNAGTGANMTIQGQNETGTTSTGGNAILQSGSGTTTNGQVQFKVAATTVGQLGIAAGDFIAMGASPTAAAGSIRLPNNVTGMSFRNAANSADNFTISNTTLNTGSLTSTGAIALSAQTSQNFFGNSWVIGDSGAVTRMTMNTVNSTSVSLSQNSSQVAFTMNYIDLATNSATGGTMTIAAQNATGTTSTGGDLILQPGTGTTVNGRINLNNVITATSATAGSNGAVPAQVVGYVSIKVNGSIFKMPYFNT